MFAKLPHTVYAAVPITTLKESTAELQAAVAKTLCLDVPPHMVCLLREKRGGVLSPLDSWKTLEAQGVKAGSRITVEVLPPAIKAPQAYTPLPPFASLTGLISTNPEEAAALASSHPAQVEALGGAHSTPSQRIEALGTLVAAHLRTTPQAATEFKALPLFSTLAHGALVGELVTHARNLSQGRYVGFNGACCRTLVGARGIGKSAMLQAFALAGASAFPGVIPVYLSGTALSDPSHALQAGHIRSILVAAARPWGVEVDSSMGPYALSTALQSRGQRMLLLVDEFDELFKHAVDDSLRRNVQASLAILQHLGNQASGLYSVLLCGSSSSTYKLVCSEDAAHLGKKFPLLALGTPNLNSDKFQRTLLPSASCAATGEVEHMLQALVGQPGGWGLPPGDVPATARLVTFFLGATPRAVTKALQPGELVRIAGEHIAFTAPTDIRAAATGSEFAAASQALYYALLKALVAANSELRAATKASGASGGASLTAVMDPTQKWEATLVPLKWPQVEEAWGEVQGPGGMAPHTQDWARLAFLVEELADRHLLHLRYNQQGEIEVWPVSAAQVVAGSKEGKAWLAQLLQVAQTSAVPLIQALTLISPLVAHFI